MRRAGFSALLLAAGCRAAIPQWCAIGEPREDSAALVARNAAKALEQQFGGAFADTDAELRMQRVAAPLCRACGIEPTSAVLLLLDSSDLNALSLPGPRIYITRRLYSDLHDEAMLAAVIAHELAHVRSGDHYKPRSAGAADALQRELDADADAVEMLRSAGVAPQAMAAALRVVQSALPDEWARQRTAALAGDAVAAN